jgi:hypothetical protein
MPAKTTLSPGELVSFLAGREFTHTIRGSQREPSQGHVCGMIVRRPCLLRSLTLRLEDSGEGGKEQSTTVEAAVQGEPVGLGAEVLAAEPPGTIRTAHPRVEIVIQSGQYVEIVVSAIAPGAHGLAVECDLVEVFGDA